MRVKSIVYSFALVMGVLLSGCGSSDSEGEVRLSTQQMLDKGDFEGVISTLGEENLTTDQNILLGMAYLGKSGATLTNIITLLDESSAENGDEFSTFVTKLKDKRGDTALPDLSKSKEFFLKALGDATCGNSNLTTSQKDICTFAGLSDTTKSALTVSYLVEELDTFTTDESDDKLTASTCAMAYAFDGTADDACSGFTEGEDVTFEESQKTYTELTVTVTVNSNSEDYAFLLTDTTPQATAVTDGFCSNTDFSTRQEASQDGLFPCPVVTTPDETEITAMDTLVDTLNNGLDSIQAEDGSDLADQIQKIKDDITNTDNSTELITEQDIINYLNDQNK